MNVPWYMPVAATVGLALVAVSLWRRRTIIRGLVFAVVMVVAGFTWMFVLGTRLPPYAGPVAVGRPFPAFATARADGAPFTQRDLSGDGAHVMVFFRGRW